jgi:Zn-dependent membrane protease YugP
MTGYYILALVIGGISMLVSSQLKSKFKKYSKVTLRNGMSGAEIAEKMLSDHGIRDVKVVSTPGMLTDHYNPKTKTVNLSEGVYSKRNASAAAVAAHECGHAVQHAVGYEWLQMRSKLVPVVSVGGKLFDLGYYCRFVFFKQHGFRLRIGNDWSCHVWLWNLV